MGHRHWRSSYCPRQCAARSAARTIATAATIRISADVLNSILVKNLSQIIRDLHDLRGRTNLIQHDFLVLLDVELGVFGRNREHIIASPPQTRGQLREFTNNVSIKRAEIGNFLTQFYQQNATADQLQASQNIAQAQWMREASTQSLQSANAAADRLHQLLSDGDKSRGIRSNEGSLGRPVSMPGIGASCARRL